MKQVALITGASSGIGREFAYLHAEHGGDIVIVARNQERLEALKQELESKYSVEIYVVVKDLWSATWVHELYEEITEKWIIVEHLINNAWFWGQGFFHERKWEEDYAMIELNIRALTELTRYILPGMVERKRWTILNVSSTASLLPWPLQAVYFATKSYVTSFSNALSRELRWTGVTVTNLMPWATETWFWKQAWLEGTKLFEKTVPASLVAREWYEAMLQGKMNIISWVSFMQRITFALIPFLPKSKVLDMVYDLQKK